MTVSNQKKDLDRLLEIFNQILITIQFYKEIGVLFRSWKMHTIGISDGSKFLGFGDLCFSLQSQSKGWEWESSFIHVTEN